ncbi:hypothetical protein [Microtetraspora sp. NBRC 13810]|nr:hypothetical protein [Microtetraspora sp. NBRC 13810]
MTRHTFGFRDTVAAVARVDATVDTKGDATVIVTVSGRLGMGQEAS